MGRHKTYCARCNRLISDTPSDYADGYRNQEFRDRSLCEECRDYLYPKRTMPESRFCGLTASEVLDAKRNAEKWRRLNVQGMSMDELVRNAELGALVRKLPRGWHLKHCYFLDSWSCHSGSTEMVHNEQDTPEKAIQEGLKEHKPFLTDAECDQYYRAQGG